MQTTLRAILHGGDRGLTGLVALAIALIPGLVPASIQAATIHVPGDEPTIQAGIDAAALFGDEVVVADGTYTGPGNRDIVLTKNITVRSASGDPALCIIDCQASGRGFHIDGVVSVARVEGFTVTNGLAGSGGGILFDNASATVEGCWILGNTANVTGGGGLSMENGSDPLIVGCLISGNLAAGYAGGGGVYNVGGDPRLVNCVLSGNTTSGLGVVGGAMRNTSGGGAMLTNCTLSANSAYDATALYTDGTGSTTTVVNTVIWGHGPGTTGVVIQDKLNGTTTITYSLVQQAFAGGGNVNDNPGFLDPDGPDNVTGTADDDVRLSKFSPAADAGNNGAPDLAGITVDLAGNPRFVDDANVPDTGSGSAPLVDMGAYERQEASVNVSILVPVDAVTIQEGIDLAQLGDHVVLADGTYTGFGNKELVITKGVTVRSGSGNPNACIIDCQGSGRAVNFVGAPLAATVQGITLTGGSAGEGGAVLFDGSSGTLHGCKVTGNTATATGGGGVMVKNGSTARFTSSTFIGNSTSGIGVVGGALYIKDGSAVRLENCALWQNSAYDATALYSAGSGTQTTVVNSIVWDHGPGTSGVPIQSPLGAVTSVTYSDVEDGYPGTGNIDQNPIFADVDLRLAPISPCLDVGSNAEVTADTDYDGHIRIYDGGGGAVVDMGPFEFGSGSSVGVIDTLPGKAFAMLPPWPNPAPAGVHIAFNLGEPERVLLEIYDVSGRRVRTLVDRELSEGLHYFTWDGTDRLGRPAAAGLYLARLIAGPEHRTQKVLRVR